MNCNNKYKNLYNKVSLSEKKVKEIKNMTVENETPIRKFKLGYALVIAAIIALLIMGNVVTYAVTGETAVEKVVNVVKSATMHKTEEFTDADGNQHVKYEINDSGASAEFEAIIYDSEFNVDISEDLSEAEGGSEAVGSVEIIISDKDSDISDADSTSTAEPNN